MSLAICVNVYNDQNLMFRLLEQVKTHCPNIPLLVIGDGIKLQDHFKKDNIWFECYRAKAKAQKGLWTQRYLKLFLERTNASNLLRIDPDTCIWKSFSLPDGDYDIFGTIEEKRYKHPYVRGGCIGFTRAAAEKIVESKFLLENRYLRYNYQRYKYFKWDHETASDEEFAFQDWIVGDIAHRLDLKLKEWKEIYILGNENKIPQTDGFAITHPHPYIERNEI